MFCKFCGKQLSGGSAFCMYCGKQQSAAPPPANYPQPSAYSPQQRPINRGKSGYIVLALAIVAFAFSIFFALQKFKVIDWFDGEDGITGKWTATEIETQGMTLPIETAAEMAGQEIEMSFDFRDDGTVIGNMNGDVTEGTYEVNGSDVEVTLDGDAQTLAFEAGRLRLDIRGMGTLTLTREGGGENGNGKSINEGAESKEAKESAQEDNGAEGTSGSIVGLWYNGMSGIANLIEFTEDGTFIIYGRLPEEAAEYDLSRDKSIDYIGDYTINGDVVEVIRYSYLGDGERSEIGIDKTYHFKDGILTDPSIRQMDSIDDDTPAALQYLPYDGTLWP